MTEVTQSSDVLDVLHLLRDEAGVGNSGLIFPRGNYWQGSGSLLETE